MPAGDLPPIQPQQQTLPGVTQVVTEQVHACAIYGSGAVACWGRGAPDPVPVAL